jgi:hypothetical protein
MPNRRRRPDEEKIECFQSLAISRKNGRHREAAGLRLKFNPSGY